MTHQEIRERFLAFFKERDHVQVPSSSLLPDDPSVLFTTAGMQQFKPYYTGEADAKHDFGVLNTVSIQKCIRTSDIDEVGDESHLTFFEMMGNFSFGGYFKEEAIKFAHEFITQELGLVIDFVSVFGGEGDVPADTESEEVWKQLDPRLRIERHGRADNFWGPTGDSGPCGPTTEIYVDGIEVWNIVFNQYFQKKDGSVESLKTPGIDTGMGIERLALSVQKAGTVFETDLFAPIMQKLSGLEVREQRIVADHLRASVFLITDGVTPSNKEQGYILRRLLRRMLLLLQKTEHTFSELLDVVVDQYGALYEIEKETVASVVEEESKKFNRTVAQGVKEIEKLSEIDAASAFRLYESFGLPYEVIKDLGGEKADGLTREAFDEAFKQHQERSRAGAQKKFGGHGLLLDTGELKAANEEELKKVTRLHTATHLLHAALRKVLGENVQQAGSDITAERTRFDFTFSRKVTPEELKQVEDLVNDSVEKDLPVTKETLPREKAEETGALHFFRIKYPPMVDVYTVGNKDNWFSKEFCGGPHVTHTGEIGTVTITKEEAVSAGVRRIRATIS